MPRHLSALVVACSACAAIVMLLAGVAAGQLPDATASGDAPQDASAIYVLGAYSAVSQSADAARISNIAIAAHDLDEKRIAAGETISLNALLGNTTDDQRYSEAPAYNGSGTVAERGGGVCQVTSALYVAALQAGLEIVERHAHSVAVDYVPVGLDATISYGGYDLKIKNNFDAPVDLRVQSDGQTVSVSVVCSSPQGSEDIERKVTSEVTSRYKGYGAGSQRSDYYDVTSYLITYEQGLKVDKVEIASDTYQILSDSNMDIASDDEDE